MRLPKVSVALVLALVAGCTGGATNLGVDKDTGHTDVAGVEVEVAVAEVSVPDVPDVFVLPEVMPDLSTPEIEPGCKPGEGCFLDPCEEGDDCLSGLCVDHMGDAVCTETCVEECAGGWLCEQVGGGGPDLQFACVSPFTHLCRPCIANSDCESPTGVEDVCLQYGAGGNFCGADCSAGECPGGYTCLDATTVDGTVVKQCVSDSGLCSCSEKAKKLGLQTTCSVGNDDGVCFGLRVCTEAGLGPCDAPSPAPEECNGLDDDCDGETDNVSCDDENDCTDDSCDPELGCKHEPLSGTECLDGSACTLADHCEEGECVGTLINCQDGNICTDDNCDPTGGCVYGFNNAACDDGDPCTINDQCAQAACAGFPLDCDCQADQECMLLEDGDVCNGTLVCDTSAFPHKCVVDPDTVIECDELDGPGAACLKSACNPASGECTTAPANDGLFCDDGDPCTVGDSCSGGVCLPGVPVNCNDGNVCTDDTCDPEDGCFFESNALPCEDGNVCTMGDQCAGGQCQAGAEAECDDGNVCTDDSCLPGIGCLHQFNTNPCNDLNECTAGDECKAGLCAGLSPVSCNDGNLCTDDSCNPSAGCSYKHNANPCDDGNVCTTGDACKSGTCQGVGALNCDDANNCTLDWCDPVEGCVHQDNDGPCDDGNNCTTGDACSGGVCKSTGILECDDNNPCTSDTCEPGPGCVFNDNTMPCNDGDACTTGDVCADGACVSTGVLGCDDGNPCTDDSCDAEEGCKYTPNQEECDDGNECTEVDECQGGVCKGSVAADCDDDDVCTDDSCDPETGCSHKLNTAPCDDGDMCTTTDKCSLGLCKGSGELDCDDGNSCTADSCAPGAGCEHPPVVGDCDDGNPCTEGDVCVSGVCAGSSWVVCDDGNMCTDDICDPAVGCVAEFNTVDCDDEDPCTVTDHCLDGACEGFGALDCDDDNVCTDDSCAPGQGCQYGANNLLCNDGSVCTSGDSCAGGVCVGGPEIDCDDGDECTANECDPDDGCHYPSISPCCGNGIVEQGESCDDGNDVNNDDCKNDCTLTTPTVPGFSGELGPVFGDGWLQCEGYYDKPGGDDVPKNWGDDCDGNAYSKTKMVCGASLGSYRFIDVNKNVFKDGLASYPEDGLIYNANYSGYENKIYADGNHPHNGSSWWGGGDGCSESSKNTTVNNSCSWEASNCFGQNLNGNRYLWLYVKP